MLAIFLTWRVFFKFNGACELPPFFLTFEPSFIFNRSMDAGDPGNRDACARVYFFIDLVYVYYPGGSGMSMMNINTDNPYARDMSRLYRLCKGL